MNLIAVPPEQAQEAWPLAEKYVFDACDQSGFSDGQEVLLQVLMGQALLWLAAEGMDVIGAGVTRLLEERGTKKCEIYAWGAKDQKKCAPLLKTIEDFAKAEGCASVRLLGRRGWARMLPDYRMAAVILEKAL